MAKIPPVKVKIVIVPKIKGWYGLRLMFRLGFKWNEMIDNAFNGLPCLDDNFHYNLEKPVQYNG